MACGLAHKETGDSQRFRDAVACGQKFESPHLYHYCMSCGNRGSEVCEKECFYGTTCHYSESTEQIRKVVASVMAAIRDIKEDMAERGNPVEVAASTGSYWDEALGR